MTGTGGQSAGAEELGRRDGIERFEAVDVLRGQVERAARSRQDAQVGAGAQERPDEVGDLVDQVLAVVQDQDGSGLGEGGGQGAARVTGDHSGASDGIEQDPDQIGSG